MSEQDVTSASFVSDSVAGSTATEESNLVGSDLDDYLAHRQRRLQSAIRRQHRLISNNPDGGGSQSATEDETAGLLHCYRNQVASERHFDVPNLGDEVQQLYVAANLVASLASEEEQMDKLIADIERQIKILDEENEQREEQIRTLKEIMKKRETEGDMKQETKVEVKFKKSQQLFDSFKVAVNAIISECFNNREDDIKDILGDLCQKFFEGSSMYTDVADIENEVIALLVDANVIVRHKHDKALVRLNTAF